LTDNGKDAASENSVVSMFSGCGGLDLGFRGGFEVFGRSYPRLPFRVEWANDINAAACETYRRNLSDVILRADVWDVIDTIPRQADVVIGGFPCQDISINGKRSGIVGDRSGLYRAMVEAVGRSKPRVFVAENVKGLLLKYNKDSLRQVLADFSALGYRVTYHLYHAADYGVPQVRERVFIVGTSRCAKLFEPPTPTRERSAWTTAKEAIGDLEAMEESWAINHIWSRANHSPEQGSRRTKANRPAHTIRAECHGNIQYHYSLPRRLSMREAARIQSFPDDFIFAAKLRETERQVGNAVPPVLAWHVAKAVANCLS
jgi:DNA (cytosine-5)-methyltransferase 1